jgi:NADH dehydrogenase
MNFVSELVSVVKPTPIVPVPGDGQYRGQPVSLDDVSQTIVQSLTHDATISETYELGGPEKLTYDEVLEAVIGALALNRTLVHIPLGLIEVAAALLGRFKFFPATSEQLEMLVDGNVVENAADEAHWKDAFQLPMKRFGPSVSKMLRAQVNG